MTIRGYSMVLVVALLLPACAIPVVVQTSPAANRNIDGLWKSTGNRAVYQISQSGDQFTWTVKTLFEQATGRFVNDRTVKVRWDGDQGSGGATGTIGDYDTEGRPTRINWSNGTAFIRLK